MVCYLCGSGMGKILEMNLDILFFGKGEICCIGKDVVLFVFGSMVLFVQEVGDEFNVMVVNMCFVKFIDVELIVEFVGNYFLFVSIEENVVIGGVGLEIECVFVENGYIVLLICFGLFDCFIDYGEQGQFLVEVGFDKDGIVSVVWV